MPAKAHLRASPSPRSPVPPMIAILSCICQDISNGLIASKLFNFAVTVADLAKNGDGVLSQRRNRIKSRRATRKPQWAGDNRNRAHWRLHFPDHPPRDHLRMRQNLANAFHLSMW